MNETVWLFRALPQNNVNTQTVATCHTSKECTVAAQFFCVDLGHVHGFASSQTAGADK